MFINDSTERAQKNSFGVIDRAVKNYYYIGGVRRLAVSYTYATSLCRGETFVPGGGGGGADR